MIGFILGMSLTAYADDSYAGLKNTTNVIKFDGKDWYLIDYDDTTVTLLSKECVGASAYNDSDGNNSRYVDYADSTVKTVVDNWYKDNISTDAKTAVNGDMFLLTKEQVKENQETYKIAKEVLKCSRPAGLPEGASNVWWLCSRAINKVTITSSENEAVVVRSDDGVVDYFGGRVHYMFGVRPALKLNLSSVIFSSESNTFLIKKDVTGVSLNKPEITLNVNDTKTLTAEIEPADTEITATDKTVTWESSNANIASVDSNGKITAVSEGEAIITVTTHEGNFTDTCKVTVKKDVCTITFDPNGGKGDMDPQKADKGETVQLKANEFTRSGYSFTKWNTEPDGSGNDYSDKQSVKPEDNMTLYAQWKENEPDTYSVTVKTDGKGEATASPKSGKTGDKINLSADADSGWRFDKWKVVSGDIRLEDPEDEDTSFVIKDSDVVVKAVFEKKEKHDDDDEEPAPNKEEKYPDGFDELRGLLNKAVSDARTTGQNQTVTWNKGTSLPYDVMKMLQDNPKVTLVFSYTYLGQNYTVTIPGSAVIANPAVQWYGPVYLYALYGNNKAALQPSQIPSATGTYTIKPGDSLSAIAKRLKTTVKHLKDVNNIKDVDKIKPGMVLKRF